MPEGSHSFPHSYLSCTISFVSELSYNIVGPMTWSENKQTTMIHDKSRITNRTRYLMYLQNTLLSLNMSSIRYTSICCTDYSNLNSIPNFSPFYHLALKNTLVTFTISVHVLFLEKILMIYDIDGIIRVNLHGHTITLQGLHILVPCNLRKSM